MEMDKAPLNKAHQLERKAELLNRQKKIEECMQCHAEAVELYKNCLQIEGDKNALESIQLQKKWNERQIRMLQLKKTYLECAENAVKDRVATSKLDQKKADENIFFRKILTNFEVHDSLICHLAKKGADETPDRDCSIVDEEAEEQEGPFIIGNKLPKDRNTIMEELRELSCQLKESVQDLLIRLDDANMEVEDRVNQIEDRNKVIEYKDKLIEEKDREIALLKLRVRNLELEKSVKEDGKFSNENFSSALSGTADLSLEFQSLPPLEALTIPELDMNCFKHFRMPEVSQKLLSNNN